MRPPSTYTAGEQAIIPAAYASEMFLTPFYDAVVRTKDDPPAQVFLLGSDSEPIRAEKSLYDLATWTRSHHELAESLALHLQPTGDFLGAGGRLERSGMARVAQPASQAHLSAYGHMVYNLDFMNPVPR